MQCAVHSDRKSVGYCKKCGRFGCPECLTRIEIRGNIGTQSRGTEAIICRECLAKIRPDLVPSKDSRAGAAKKKPAARARKAKNKPARALAVGAALALALFVIWAAAAYLPRANVSTHFVSAEKVAADGLDALAAGNAEQFLSCVDVCEFMCRMDPTGITRRDYEEACASRRDELLASHGMLLTTDLFVAGNLGKGFTVVSQDVKDESAYVAVKPWIQFGNRLYKRILLEKERDGWKICGLASPDY